MGVGVDIRSPNINNIYYTWFHNNVFKAQGSSGADYRDDLLKPVDHAEVTKLRESYRNSEYLTIRLIYDATEKSYTLYANDVYMGAFTEESLGVSDWGTVCNVGFGVVLDTNAGTSTLKDWSLSKKED